MKTNEFEKCKFCFQPDLLQAVTLRNNPLNVNPSKWSDILKQ